MSTSAFGDTAHFIILFILYLFIIIIILFSYITENTFTYCLFWHRKLLPREFMLSVDC